LFSKTTGSNLTRLGKNYPWVKVIQICSKEGDSPYPRGDNSKRVKIHCKISKIFFSRTSRPRSIKRGTNYPWVTGIEVCLVFFFYNGPGPLQRGDNHKDVKKGWGLLKIFSRTTGPILTDSAQIILGGKWIQVSSNEGDCPSSRGGNSKRVKTH
jgi:hypothetical protein